jgi:hypothetical protein
MGLYSRLGAAALVPMMGGATACAPYADAQETWTVSEERRIGPPAAEFGAVTDAAMDGAGRLWVVDGLSGELHIAGENELRRIAGPGQGPGELSPGAIEIVMLAGDTALVIEPQTRRMHRYAPDGTHVRTTTITGEEGLTGGWRALPGHRLAARIYPSSIIRPAGAAGPAGDPVREFDALGAAGDVLAMLPPTESFRMGDGPMPIITLLAPQPVWDVDESGRVVEASTHTYEVRAHGSDDVAATILAQPADGNEVDAALEAKARELLRETLLERRTPRPVADQMVAAASVAEAAPVLGGIMAGPAGTLWVQQAASTADELLDLQRPGGPTWHIHDDRGRHIGTATMPVGVQPLEWRGNRLVGIARDPLGRTSAIVLRVEVPGR